ncbi:MAG TPA: hypothetical protein VLU43_03680 [Anaeromyxobacteraceae bacterium]|nr:hypothetical protein [Anaeromyxobacteraceae bacterium]
MVEVHVLNGWLRPDARQGLGYAVLNMIGGFAAPGFLYMAGLSQGLADAAQAAKGIPAGERRRLAVRRGFWLLGVAYGFRVAEYLLGYAPALAHGWWGALRQGLAGVVKVDVLNVIAVGMIVAALLAVGRGARGAALAGAAALAVALATPLVAGALGGYDLAPGGGPPARVAPGMLADHALSYLWGSWPRAQFSLFNWVAFLLAGAALAPLARGPGRPLVWLGLAAGLYGLGWWADRWPPVYAHQDFWLTSPSWFLMRLGICVAITGLLQLLPELLERPLRWLTLMGRQSLVGYIASVELTYGAAASAFQGALSFRATVWGIVAMIGVTWGVSVGWDRFQAWRKARARAAMPPAVA